MHDGGVHENQHLLGLVLLRRQLLRLLWRLAICSVLTMTAGACRKPINFRSSSTCLTARPPQHNASSVEAAAVCPHTLWWLPSGLNFSVRWRILWPRPCTCSAQVFTLASRSFTSEEPWRQRNCCGLYSAMQNSSAAYISRECQVPGLAASVCTPASWPSLSTCSELA